MELRPIFFFLFFCTQISFSQFEYGLKGGLNFGSSGDIVVVTDQLQKEGDLTSKTGYHLGVYSEVYFLMFYLRPEFQYTKLSSQFEDNLIDNERIELPLSLGYSILGPISLFLGPIAYFNLSQKANELKLEKIQNTTSLGLHIGARLKLGALGVDVRYEKGLSTTETKLLSQSGISVSGQIDSQKDQFTLGVSFKIN
ncbi:MAG: hypothetical protein VX994_04940 [Bacteroidota bacterium]|nr:hypothetical protein [Bacteroidota bacterium]